jgi:hypothetical protein
MLILNSYIISNNKEKIKSATIKEGDDIALVTFFVTNQKRKANLPFPCNKAKKVPATVIFFFNTKLQPSLLCYKGKKNKKQKKKVMAIVITFFVQLHTTSEEEEQGDGLRCNAAPQ